MCSSLLLAGRSIISIRRSICGRSGVPFLQGRLLLQQVCHAAQADAKKTAPEELCQIDTIPPTIEKTERSQRGTPCCTYHCRMWLLAGCVRVDAPCFCFYGNSCCSICNERVISANAQCSGLIQNPPCKSCTDLVVLRSIGAFPPAQQFIF